MAVLIVALIPALAAIWSVPWFVTQDGPAHVYNAEILAASVEGFDRTPLWHDVYTVRWQAIPNWAGPLSLAALVAWLPAWLADRIMTSLTLVGFVLAILWLRWRVAGARGLSVAVLLAVIISMNIAWLFGFTSFMLGACLLPVTLGYWWPVRDRLTVVRQTTMAALLTLGYFCHLVSLGLTVVSLVVLSMTAPSDENDRRSARSQRLSRLVRTCVTFGPVVLLGIVYLLIATQRSAMRPRWDNLENPWSIWAWVGRLKWADPLSLAIRDGLPFSERVGVKFVLFAPVIWVAASVTFWFFGRIDAYFRGRNRDHGRGWLHLAAVFMVGGVVGPDSLGEAHGDYLPQRIVLIGLVALVPVFDIDLTRLPGRLATVALAIAVALQSAIIWDYALYSDRTAGQIIRAGAAVGQGQRVAALVLSTRSRFRPNPILHSANWLGIGTGNVIWNNYETLYYYFPVHFKAGVDRPQPDDLERISIHDDPSQAGDRARAWERVLLQHAGSIDVVVVWKGSAAFDSITTRWFDQVERRGDVQIWRRGASKGN